MVKEKSKFISYDLRHLAILALLVSILALLGDVETLKSYRKNFAEDDRLGFEEGIEKVHLERPVVVVAQEGARAKKPSYDLLEQVAVVFFPQNTVKLINISEAETRSYAIESDSHKKLVEEKKQ
ncbi:hypothetical protein [Bartonella sp. B39]